jgi:cytochrome c553
MDQSGDEKRNGRSRNVTFMLLTLCQQIFVCSQRVGRVAVCAVCHKAPGSSVSTIGVDEAAFCGYRGQSQQEHCRVLLTYSLHLLT